MLCQSRLHTASENDIRHKKLGSGSIFGFFVSVASILIGKDDKYEKKNSDSVCKALNPLILLLTRGSYYKEFVETGCWS